MELKGVKPSDFGTIKYEIAITEQAKTAIQVISSKGPLLVPSGLQQPKDEVSPAM